LEVKSNRRRPRSRRATPKPVAAMLGGLVSPAQVTCLLRLAQHVPSVAGRAIAELALEAALTEAHLAPHPARQLAPEQGAGISGEAWLKVVESVLKQNNGLIAKEELAVFTFRVSRMRAWIAKKMQVVEDEDLRYHPYVAACLALEQKIVQPEAKVKLFVPATSGLLMHLPALRSKGIL
jgi:hypothetical protein